MNTGTVSIDDRIKPDDWEIKHNPATVDPSPLEKLERKQVQQQVQWCINTIAESFREVLVLKDIQGFSYTEISKMLNIPDGTVKSKLYRARDFLKVCLKNVFGDLAHVVS
jgi:RNA polymerase sigma-70 factor (ECF subfamily)